MYIARLVPLREKTVNPAAITERRHCLVFSMSSPLLPRDTVSGASLAVDLWSRLYSCYAGRSGDVWTKRINRHARVSGFLSFHISPLVVLIIQCRTSLVPSSWGRRRSDSPGRAGTTAAFLTSLQTIRSNGCWDRVKLGVVCACQIFECSWRP